MSPQMKPCCQQRQGTDALLHCKQCGGPMCEVCVVPGPTGQFCSDTCKNKHEIFAERARQLEGRAGTGAFTKLKNAVAALVVALAAVAAVVFVATTIDIPVLTDLAWKVRGIIGI